MDLHLDLAGPRVKRAALEQALRAAVQTGRLPPGTRLPSSRALAGDLGVARNTVANAYGQLVAEGWLVARSGSSTVVADQPASLTSPASSHPPAPPVHRYDLRPGSPDLSSFPRSAWLAAARVAMREASDDLLGYGDPRGTPQLRQALSTYLARARGVRCSPERIVVCCGFTQGLGLICEALKAGGTRRVAIEQYGLTGNRATIVSAGLDATTLTIDDEGADVAAAGDAEAMVLTPAHQFPLGMVLPPERRSLAVHWAQQHHGVIVEDDYDGEFCYDQRSIGALQGLAPDHVIYAGTASKTLAPGLRLSWLVVPSHLVDHIVEGKARRDRQSETVGQLTFAAFIASGGYDRHIRRRRHAYRRRRNVLIAALAGLPVQVSGASAGLHAVVRLPHGVAEDEVVAHARQRGLALEGLSAYGSDDQPHRPALVVGYAAPPDHSYTTAVAQLRATLDDHL